MSYENARRYWTVQTVEAWDAAQARGFLRGTLEYIDEDFVEAYRWLVRQMQQRLHVEADFWPVWLWPTRPDLRRAEHDARGTRCVLLEVELDPAFTLASDHGTWHHVLMGIPLYTLAEDADPDASSAAVPLEASWERIFDFEWLRQADDYGEPSHVQVTTPWVHVGQVKTVRYFTAR
jgi:hypothetical protein